MALALACNACSASVAPGEQWQTIDGRVFDSQIHQEIVEGKTSVKDIISSLGPSFAEGEGLGMTIHRYWYVRCRKVLVRVGFRTDNRADLRVDQLTLWSKDGIVRRFESASWSYEYAPPEFDDEVTSTCLEQPN
jgi:hypothetical protein